MSFTDILQRKLSEFDFPMSLNTHTGHLHLTIDHKKFEKEYLCSWTSNGGKGILYASFRNHLSSRGFKCEKINGANGFKEWTWSANDRYHTLESVFASSQRATSEAVITQNDSRRGLAALSIKQPAAALILYRGKNIENRTQSKFKGGGQEFNNQPQWVLIQTGQSRQTPEPTLSIAQLKAASTFENMEFEDTIAAMSGLDQTTGSIVGAMLVSEQRPPNQPCESPWASDNKVHIMIEKTIAFTQPQKCKGALCLFPIIWENLNTTIQQELNEIKDQFIMRPMPPKKFK